MEWLVKNGPRTGLFLGGSSSIAPGVSWENMKMLVEGFRYYREHGDNAAFPTCRVRTGHFVRKNGEEKACSRARLWN